MPGRKYSRRQALKTIASASIVGGVAIPEFVQPTHAELTEYQNKWRDSDIAEIEDMRWVDGHTSQAGSLGHIITEYSPARGLYLHDFRLTGTGVSVNGDGDTISNVNKQSCGCYAWDSGIEDIRPGTDPQDNGLYPESGSGADYGSAFFDLVSYGIGELSSAAGNLITAASIIDSLVQTGTKQDDSYYPGYELSQSYGDNLLPVPDNAWEFGSASEFTIRTLSRPATASAVVSAESGYGETEISWRLDFWGGSSDISPYSMSTTSSNSVTTESTIRPPEELVELHPEEMTDQERQELQVEKIRPRKFEKRAKQLNIDTKRLARWKQNGEPVYLIHNPPISVTAE